MKEANKKLKRKEKLTTKFIVMVADLALLHTNLVPNMSLHTTSYRLMKIHIGSGKESKLEK